MLFGEVRPVRYWYLTSSQLQEARLAYTLEKRMIAKLAEGETPDIDPAECASGNQSFSALITKALKEGNFDYQDPSVLLKKMTKTENAGVRSENFAAARPVPEAKVIPIRPPEPEPIAAEPATYQVIYIVEGMEQGQDINAELYTALLEANALEITLFGTYVKQSAKKRQAA